jgi:hypothetical protein
MLSIWYIEGTAEIKIEGVGFAEGSEFIEGNQRPSGYESLNVFGSNFR